MAGRPQRRAREQRIAMGLEPPPPSRAYRPGGSGGGGTLITTRTKVTEVRGPTKAERDVAEMLRARQREQERAERGPTLTDRVRDKREQAIEWALCRIEQRRAGRPLGSTRRPLANAWLYATPVIGAAAGRALHDATPGSWAVAGGVFVVMVGAALVTGRRKGMDQ